MATITAANAVFMLNVPGVTFAPTQLQGFGVDDAFTNEAVEAAETQIGVDGFGVAGYVPREVAMTIRFLASAPAPVLFENWIAYQDTIQDVAYAAGTIILPSVGRKYTCYMGALMRVSTMADVRKVLANREFRINWLPQGTVPAISAAPA